MQNTVVKKRAGQRDGESDYRFGNFLQRPARAEGISTKALTDWRRSCCPLAQQPTPILPEGPP
jgi:hypothetical protein